MTASMTARAESAPGTAMHVGGVRTDGRSPDPVAVATFTARAVEDMRRGRHARP